MGKKTTQNNIVNETFLQNSIGLQKDLIEDIKHKLCLLGLVQLITKKDFCLLANKQMEETLFVKDCSQKEAIELLSSAFSWDQVYSEDLKKLREHREYIQNYNRLMDELNQDLLQVGFHE